MGNLNALQVKHAKPGQRLSDGDGLRLEVDLKGRGRWFFRFTSPVTGKERLAGFGPLREVSLADARELAAQARSLIRKRIDPLEAKRAEREATRVEERRTVTLAAYSEAYIKSHESAWRNPNHRRNWRSSLSIHVLPIIGHLAVSDIGTDEVLTVLRPIWNDKHETARNVRQRLEAILAAATVEGLRSGQNPAVWRNHLDHLLARRKRVKEHFAALPHSEMPAFWRSLAGDTSPNAALVRWTILTVARYSEAANADWAEVDLDRKLWVIPSGRMKAGREHSIPLSAAAMAVLSESTTKTGLIFPAVRSGKKTSDVSLAKCIRRHTALPATLHGFRSTFRDHVGDQTDFAREVAEHCLAHAVGNAVEQAYRRGTAIEKRRQLMEAWANYCAGKSTA